MKKILFLSTFLLCFLGFVNFAQAETYTYTATNFQPTSFGCPYAQGTTVMNLVSPGDIVKIIGTGFGYRNLADGLDENVFIPINSSIYNVYRGQRNDGPGNDIYYGPMSWQDNEIDLEITQGLGNSLGSYIILRTYNSVDKTDTNGNCIRGTLAAGLICTSFAYSDWSTCQSNSTKTRTTTSSSPNGCSGGDPVLTQSCSYVPACTVNDYSCGDWNSCSVSGNQTRTCNKTSNCEGGTQMPEISQSCTYTPPACNSWTYSNWSSCSSNGNQTRDIVSSSPNGCTGGNPVLSQSCSYVSSCTSSDWSCDSWEACSKNNNQGRTCNRISNCQGGVSSPAISQSCTYVAPVPSCNYFNYSNWSECSPDGKQTRNITSKYPYNCENGESPKTTQSCTYTPAPIYGCMDRTATNYNPSATSQTGVACAYALSCTADTWTCGDWNTCSLSGVQNRSCRKTFDCPNVETAPPTIDQYCEAPSRPAQQVPQEGSDVISNQDVIIRSTVKLLCPVDAQKASQGSGTIIDSNGTILTNKHVIAGTLGCLVGFISDFNDEPYFGERQIADIAKVSPNQDIAILKIRNPQNKVLPNVDITKGNSNLRLGVKITTYGYPAKFGTKITYTSGDFSGTDGSYIKTTAILEYGNSGGGAYLKDGTFIGVPSAVVKGELNALGYILSINTINSWLGNSSITYGGTNNNNYSRVSVLEDIDLNKLGALKLFIPDTDTKGNLIAPATNQSVQKTTEQPKNDQTQKESTIVKSADINQKINPEQNNPAPPEKKSTEEKGNDSSIKIPEQRRSTVSNAVQEMIKVAERNGEVGQEIKTIAQTQTKNQEELEIGVHNIQSRSGFARFFVGPNYSEIRKSQTLLEQNKEQIQKLNQLRAQIIDQKDQQQIAEQVQLLGQATQQIENTLNEDQKGFSLFGWMFRLFVK